MKLIKDYDFEEFNKITDKYNNLCICKYTETIFNCKCGRCGRLI